MGERSANVYALAHELKGSASNMGAIRLAELSKEIEHAAQAEDWSRVEELLRQIIDEVGNIAAFITSRAL